MSILKRALKAKCLHTANFIERVTIKLSASMVVGGASGFPHEHPKSSTFQNCTHRIAIKI